MYKKLNCNPIKPLITQAKTVDFGVYVAIYNMSYVCGGMWVDYFLYLTYN